MAEKLIRGVSCSSCGGSLEITEGTLLLNCKFCGGSLMVKGDRGIGRTYVALKRSKDEILAKIQKWFGAFNKASDLKISAKFTEIFPVYVPFWRVDGTVIGWVLGDKKEGSGKDAKYVPVERNVNQNYEFTCPACDVGEFGVKWVDLQGDEILPFDLEKVQKTGMNFEVMSTPTDVLAVCEERFLQWGEHSAHVDRKTFSRLFLLNKTCSIVYYPLWIVRYSYRNRVYQVTADGESGDLLFGRAPGNNLYRVFCLIGSLMLGNFVLTTALRNASGNGIMAIGILCLILMAFGFYQFRYGGEVKIEQKDKLNGNDFNNLFPNVKIGSTDLNSLLSRV